MMNEIGTMILAGVGLIALSQLISYFIARAVIRHLDRRDDHGGL